MEIYHLAIKGDISIKKIVYFFLLGNKLASTMLQVWLKILTNYKAIGTFRYSERRDPYKNMLTSIKFTSIIDIDNRKQLLIWNPLTHLYYMTYDSDHWFYE